MFLSVFQQVHLFSIHRLLMCMIQRRKICGCATKFCFGFDCLFLWHLFDSIICLADGISWLHENSCTPVRFSSSALQSSESCYSTCCSPDRLDSCSCIDHQPSLLIFSFRMCNFEAEWLLYGWRKLICSWTQKSVMCNLYTANKTLGMGLFWDNCVGFAQTVFSEPVYLLLPNSVWWCIIIS